MQFEPVENPYLTAIVGSDTKVVQFMANQGAQAIITGYCGPNTRQALTKAGIVVFTGLKGTVAEVAERYRNGELQPSLSKEASAVVTKPRPSANSPAFQPVSKQELAALQDDIRAMGQRVGEIQLRVERLERERRSVPQSISSLNLA
jgi:predicted Fe-Mo cluster-binding NifX family protein